MTFVLILTGTAGSRALCPAYGASQVDVRSDRMVFAGHVDLVRAFGPDTGHRGPLRLANIAVIWQGRRAAQRSR